MKTKTASIINAMLILIALYSAPGQCATARNHHQHHSSHSSHSRRVVHGQRTGHPTATGSFLGTMVYTAPDLIEQMETHPAIAARYARHYHMTPANIIRYMKQNLVESYMPRTQVFKTYWVRGNGQIRTGNERLTKGTRVFALRNGQPVLKWACGNPLTVGLPVVQTVASSTAETFNAKMLPSEETMVPSEPADVIVPAEAPPTMMTEVPDEPIRFSSAATPIHAGGSPFPWPVLAIPILAGITHSGGGGSINPPPPVPESGTIVSFTLAAGLGALLMARRRRPQRA